MRREKEERGEVGRRGKGTYLRNQSHLRSHLEIDLRLEIAVNQSSLFTAAPRDEPSPVERKEK